MPRDGSFWRSVPAIGLAHVLVLVGLVRWSSHAKQPAHQEILWLNGGASDGVTTVADSSPIPAPTVEPVATPAASPEEPEANAIEKPAPTEAPAEIALPTPSPPPTATPSPSPTPKPSPTPRATASPKPSATPKKKNVAKHSPTPKPKPSATPAKTKSTPAENTPTPPAKPSPDTANAKSENTATGTTNSGTSGGGSGAGRDSKFAWYGNMLHDRFFSEWIQPKSVAPAGSKMSARVKLRIERDGRVSAFSIVRSSGNVVVDDSINAALKRVTQVDPPPRGLGGAFYEVTIRFELDLE